MMHQVGTATIVDIHEQTAALPEFERFAERIRLLFALPRPYFTNVKSLTEVQARSLAFATLPPDLDIYWEVLWAIPNRALQSCKAANEARPLGWLNMLCEIAVWARVDCIDTTEWIDERHDRPPLWGRLGTWIDHSIFKNWETKERQTTMQKSPTSAANRDGASAI